MLISYILIFMKHFAAKNAASLAVDNEKHAPIDLYKLEKCQRILTGCQVSF